MAAVTLQSGVYFIQNFGTGTVLDLAGASPANGTKIQGYKKRELTDLRVPAQLWVIAQVSSDSVYTIENVNSRSFMDINGANAQNGTPVIGHESNGHPSQHWRITRNSNDTAYVIQNVGTRTFADLDNGSSANGAPVVGWSGSGSLTTNPHQLWLIVRA